MLGYYCAYEYYGLSMLVGAEMLISCYAVCVSYARGPPIHILGLRCSTIRCVLEAKPQAAIGFFAYLDQHSSD
jgi:hypothetical protein